VVVYHLDRFARDVAALLDNLRAFAKRGVELHVVGRGRIETETASGFLMTGVEGLMAEHYRRLIGEKTRDALARLRQQGRRLGGQVEYGFTVAEDGVTLVPNPQEQETLRLIRELRPSLTLRALSQELAARGVLTRGGRAFDVRALWTLSRREVVA
jgi:DNA invertase Pin-like site-specific DNA recombinase